MDHKELAKQKKIWYAKLKQSGFKDIESESEVYLKKIPILNLVNTSKLNDPVEDEYNEIRQRFEAKSEYFRLASQFLWDHEFTREVDKFIWEQHVEGKTHRDIAALVKKRWKTIGAKTTVQDIIAKLKTIMVEKLKNEQI